MKRFLSLLVLFLIASMFAAPVVAGFNPALKTAAEADLAELEDEDTPTMNARDAAEGTFGDVQLMDWYNEAYDDGYIKQQIDGGEMDLGGGEAFYMGGFDPHLANPPYETGAYEHWCYAYTFLETANQEYSDHTSGYHYMGEEGWACVGGSPTTCYDYVNGSTGAGPNGRCGWIGCSWECDQGMTKHSNAQIYYSAADTKFTAAGDWLTNNAEGIYGGGEE